MYINNDKLEVYISFNDYKIATPQLTITYTSKSDLSYIDTYIYHHMFTTESECELKIVYSETNEITTIPIIKTNSGIHYNKQLIDNAILEVIDR